MPPTPITPTPRIVIYYQTHHNPSDAPLSILPLLTAPNTQITHLILAAIHLNEPSASSPLSQPHITLNDHPPSHPRNQTLWAELSVLRASGIKVLGMLGGAAKGSFALLDTLSASAFETAYLPLHDLIRTRSLDGLDLDVEEPMSLQGIIRLIDRLKADFGPDFIITLAPVAAALLNPLSNLSGFDYAELEKQRGEKIAWYNTQFYCGWGDMYTTAMYDAIVWNGWTPSKVVVGLVTNPENGSGWVPMLVLRLIFGRLRERYGALGFGGVMGWEYFNSLPGGRERPWEWAAFMTRVLRDSTPDMLTEGERVEAEALVARRMEEVREARRKAEEESEARRKAAEDEEARKKSVIYLADGGDDAGEAGLPGAFEYFSDEDGNDREDALLPRSFEYFTDESLEE